MVCPGQGGGKATESPHTGEAEQCNGGGASTEAVGHQPRESGSGSGSDRVLNEGGGDGGVADPPGGGGEGVKQKKTT